MGFKIETIQVDNEPEFVNDDAKTEKDSAFAVSYTHLDVYKRQIRTRFSMRG